MAGAGQLYRKQITSGNELMAPSNGMRIGRLLGFVIFLCVASLAQSGGQFQIKQSVVAGGGASSTGSTFMITGTAGQAAAGVSSIEDPFRVRGGFWQNDLAPTAALVSVSGRVVFASGIGVPKVTITLVRLRDGTITNSISNPFGFFRFDGLEASQIYLITAEHKQYQFESRILNVVDDVTDIQLTPLP